MFTSFSKSLINIFQSTFSKLDTLLLDFFSGIFDSDFPLINLRLKNTLKNAEQKLEALKPQARKAFLLRLNILVDLVLFIIFSPVVAILGSIILFQVLSIFQVHLEHKLRVQERLENYYLDRKEPETSQEVAWGKSVKLSDGEEESDQDDCCSESTATSTSLADVFKNYQNTKRKATL